MSIDLVVKTLPGQLDGTMKYWERTWEHRRAGAIAMSRIPKKAGDTQLSVLQNEEKRTMAMEGLRECAAGCGAPISGPGNLCRKHQVPGGVVRMGNRTFVVTVWYAEHADEASIILLNDFALGDLFGGRAGFEAELRRQGFKNVRNVATPQELEAVKKSANGKLAGWGGPWQTIYPWEKSSVPTGPRRARTEKCRACNSSEAETPAGMVPGLYICSAKCAEYLAAHPELNPTTAIKAPGIYEVKWPSEPSTYQVRVSRFKDSGRRLYMCPCGQAPNPEMQGATAYMTGLDEMSKACRHIGLVILFEQHLAEQTGPPVVSTVTPVVSDEITSCPKKTVLKKAPRFVDDSEAE